MLQFYRRCKSCFDGRSERMLSSALTDVYTRSPPFRKQRRKTSNSWRPRVRPLGWRTFPTGRSTPSRSERVRPAPVRSGRVGTATLRRSQCSPCRNPRRAETAASVWSWPAIARPMTLKHSQGFKVFISKHIKIIVKFEQL